MDIVHLTAADVHPPLFYWALKLWMMLFGTSDLAARSMSLFFALIGLVGLYYVIKKLFSNERWALLGVAAVVLSPMLVRFSDEARMYTMVFAIVMWATYVLLRALESSGRKWWIVYGVLIALGMYTHYFVALAWLAHWAWRWWEVRAGRQKKLFTKQWVWAHVLAVGLFAAWVPVVIYQFAVVQAGFWIPPLSAYTPIDYVSNALLYRQYGEVTGWWALLFYASAAALVYLIWYAWRNVPKKHARSLRLLFSIAFVPPVLLAVASIPPLSSSFIDRYIMYAQLSMMVLAAIGFALLYAQRKRLAIWLGIVFIATAGLGSYNVYYYGNYNKNSSTSIRVKEVISQIDQAGTFGEPIIAASPWVYYEASAYDSAEHRVYFVDANTSYEYGSLEMLRTSDIGKIKDLAAFTSLHRYVWVVDNHPDGDVVPLESSWVRVKTIDAFDSIDGNVKYRASLFDTQAEQ